MTDFISNATPQSLTPKDYDTAIFYLELGVNFLDEIGASPGVWSVRWEFNVIYQRYMRKKVDYDSWGSNNIAADNIVVARRRLQQVSEDESVFKSQMDSMVTTSSMEIDRSKISLHSDKSKLVKSMKNLMRVIVKTLRGIVKGVKPYPATCNFE